MSEPTRYRVANNQAQLTLGGNVLVVDPAGRLVEYPDYAKLRMERIHDLNQIGGLQEENARLKAEVEAQAKRWAESEDLISHYKQQMDEVINNCQCSRLKAENERLRKAGDAMVLKLPDMMAGVVKAEEAIGLMNDWTAAKEGKV